MFVPKKRLHKKDEVNFKIYDVTAWLINSYNTEIFQYSRSKDNQTMKFGQVTECNKRNIALRKLCRKYGSETSSRSLFVYRKSFIWGKSKWSVAWFQYILIVLNLAHNKLYKTLDNWSRYTFNFDFLEKSLVIVSPPHFVYDFSKNISHIMFY